jgi:hypothetical protein
MGVPVSGERAEVEALRVSQLTFDLPGVDVGQRTERVEYAVRALEDGGGMHRGDVEPCSEHKARWLTSTEARDELPYHGYPRALELLTRVVVTYTGGWSS